MATGRVWQGARTVQERLRAGRSDRWFVVTLVALTQAILVLGPSLRPGLVIVYDMAWAPDPRWTPFVLGLDTPAPRAVPSDAVAVALGRILGAGLTQKVILVATLSALGIGAARLLAEVVPLAGQWACLAVTIASVWNPYVYERLAVGQWTVLVGLALLPWAMRAALRIGRDPRSPISLMAVLVVAGMGGANSLAIVAMSVVPIFVFRMLAGDRRVTLVAAGTVIVMLGVSAAWSFPAILGDTVSTSQGARAFVPTADSPLGVLGSLMSGGGFWNTTTHPTSRDVVMVAVAAAAMAVAGVAAAVHRAVGAGRWSFIVAVALPTALVGLSVVPTWEGGWVWLVTAVPGGGLLRDSHKFMAGWVVGSAIGLGVLVELVRARLSRPMRLPASILLLGLPVALLPVLGWGLSGRLNAVVVPQEYRQSIERLNELPTGDVGLLPWNQYRRYAWNDDRVSLTLAPRLITHTVVFNDALPLRSGTVPGESTRAARITGQLAEPGRISEAFSAAGVRYVVVEKTAASVTDAAEVRLSGRTLIDEPSLLVIDLEETSTPVRPQTWPVVVGWAVTLCTAVCVAVWGTLGRRDRG